jgi:hypothetical protein
VPPVPTAPSLPTWAPVPAPTRPPRRWLIPVIIGGSFALIGLIVGVVAVAIQLATWVSEMPAVDVPSAEDPSTGTLDDLVEGDPGTPVAVEPLECSGCFALSDARTLGLPDDSYRAIGLTDNDGEFFDAIAGEEQRKNTAWWTDDGGTPDACFFSYPNAPLEFAPGDADPAVENDAVHYPAWHHDADEFYLFTEAVRVFDDSATAAAHLSALEGAVAGCPDFSLPSTGWSAVVTAAPALTLPDSVAAYGWVETGGLYRYYAIDLQRGNLVARLTLNSDPEGPGEAEFRGLVEEYARVLAALEP